MKLSRLYSNQEEEFPPIKFRPGLNVVLAQIRSPEDFDRDTHNLGKTTLAALIDFGLLKAVRRGHFLARHKDRFAGHVFFLELQLGPQSYVTIRRSVAEPTKISFLEGAQSVEDATSLGQESFKFWRLSFDRARQHLDGLLDVAVPDPWTYRHPIGYALRLQDDYQDVFQLDAHRGSHGDWKPFLAQLVGLDGLLVKEAYDATSAVDALDQAIKEVENELVDTANSLDQLEGIILVRQREVEGLSERLGKFDFREPDDSVSDELVGEIEVAIASLNERRYHLRMSHEAITATLDDAITFDLRSVESVFSDAQVYFGDQIKKDYSDLVGFLRAISSERRVLLARELGEIADELAAIEEELLELNQRRISALASIREAETFAKFRKHTERLVDAKTTLGILERQRDQLARVRELKKRLAEAQHRRTTAVEAVENNLSASAKMEGTYRTIRLEFSRIVEAVLDRSAVMSSRINQKGNIEFSAEVLDDSGAATSADMGHTYKKLLCIAFDMAVFSSYLERKFVHFVYHDGVFESLDDRKKLCLVEEIRTQCDRGLQQVITLIDSDLPLDSEGKRLEFAADEVVRVLHDQGSAGRLFRSETW